MKRFFLILLTFVVLLISCKKDSDNNILGKWKLVEVYDGYVNGGNFRWNNVANENSHTLEFSANGQYLRKENQNGNVQQCVGTYTVDTENLLEINSSCNTVTEKIQITELTSASLIIDRQVREGKIRYKYSLIK